MLSYHILLEEIKLCFSFNPFKWPALKFSSHYHTWIKHSGHENEGNDHQQEEVLIVKQILLVSTIENV